MVADLIKYLADKVSVEALQQGSIETDKHQKEKIVQKTPSIDVPNHVLADRAAWLNELTKGGNQGTLRREKLKQAITKRVWEIIGDSFDIVDEAMALKIANQIVNAAEVDPMFEALFVQK